MPNCHVAAASTHGAPVEKQQEAIQVCLDEGLVNEQTMRALLRSFISGDPQLVLKPLLQLMSAVRRPDRVACVRWVPFHMMAVLRVFGEHAPLPQQLRLPAVANGGAVQDISNGKGAGWRWLGGTICADASDSFSER